MGRSRILQILVVLLLLAFITIGGLTWWTAQSTPRVPQKPAVPPRRPAPTATPEAPPERPAAPQPETPSPSAEPSGDPGLLQQMLTHLGGTPDPGQTPDLFGARPARTGGGRDPFGFPESFQNEIRRRHLKATQPQTRPEPETSEQAPLPPLPPIQLQGIFWGIAEPQAIVNRKTVRVGDMVDQAKVVSISREGVRFLYQDHEYLVELPSAAESGPSVGFGQPQGQRVRLR